jgi:hypothetical protein
MEIQKAIVANERYWPFRDLERTLNYRQKITMFAEQDN